ncbi:hypothetical protein TrST_g9934 [Triparma strigata]|uniref:Exoribonuclease phosphorolytic domain-containing protein n=1 Tax=Triparma strigata TaxID=1606541 RepID=A0A9W7AA63_9STRA|nr:hypothetical protein TrST_g9934 [Triparma strigata]
MSSLLSLLGLRSDYRSPSQSRLITSTILPPTSSSSSSSSSQPTGTVTYSQGLTNVQVKIFGPVLDHNDRQPAVPVNPDDKKVPLTVILEVPVNPSNPDRYITVTTSSSAPQAVSSTLDSFSSSLKTAQSHCLALHSVFTRSILPPSLTSTSKKPRITIHLKVLHNDGSLLSTLINASTLALATSAIPLVDLPVSTTTAVYSSTMTKSSSTKRRRNNSNTIGGKGGMGGKKFLLLDLNLSEETSECVDSYCTSCYLLHSNEVVLSQSNNRLGLEKYLEMVDFGQRNVGNVRNEIEGIMRDWARGLYRAREGEGEVELKEGKVCIN